MSTMQQQTPPKATPSGQDMEDLGAAVEAQMGKIMTELGAALGEPRRTPSREHRGPLHDISLGSACNTRATGSVPPRAPREQAAPGVR